MDTAPSQTDAAPRQTSGLVASDDLPTGSWEVTEPAELSETTPAATTAARRARKPTDEQLRDQSQDHLDARLQRLQAYAATLEASLARASTDEQIALFEGQLTLLRRHIRASTRSHLPQVAEAAGPAGASLARALAPLRRARPEPAKGRSSTVE